MVEFLIKADPGLMAAMLKGLIPALQNAGVDVGATAQQAAEQVTIPVVMTKKATAPAQEPAPAKVADQEAPKAKADAAPALPENADFPEDLPTEIETLRALAREKQQKKGKAALRELLTKFGVPNLTSLKVEQYSAFYEELKKL